MTECKKTEYRLSHLRGYMRRTGQVPTAIVGQRKQA